MTTEGALPERVLTANQLVAYNVSRFRRNMSMTQERLAERLTLFSGKPWSKVTVSAAERSFDGTRVRQFDADDLVALSSALTVPIPGFFLPPDDDGESVQYVLAPARPDSANGVNGLLLAFVLSRDDEGPNIELFSQLTQREMERTFGDHFHPYLTGTYSLTGLSVLENSEEGREGAAVELERELAQAFRLIRRLLDSVHRHQGATRAGADEEVAD